jgi:Fe-S-cluster containining protein
MDVDFHCTQCGKCCHDLKLPLSIAEAIEWLASGHDVQILCEGIPWPVEPSSEDVHANYKRRRSFPALSGSLQIRVIVTLTASFRGACPNLASDMKCAIYERRPAVCRIYPAEVNPFVVLTPGAKACPSEAWETARSPFIRGGTLVDADTRAWVRKARDASEADADRKARVCALLGIRSTAMANEGFVVHSPDRGPLMEALRDLSVGPVGASEMSWRFVSNRRSTVGALDDLGADVAMESSATDSSFAYIGFNPTD